MSRDPRRLADLVAPLIKGDSMSPLAVDDDPSKLVYFGNPQDAVPRMLLLDDRLEPVDIVTWQVVRIHAEPGQAVAFPDYEALMRWVRVSRGTVARAIAALRLTRWLLVLKSPRLPTGRFSGNVYALVDEPLDLPETLSLDEGYVAFVDKMRVHRQVHIRKLAIAVFAEIEARASSSGELGAVLVREQLVDRFEKLRELLAGFASRDPECGKYEKGQVALVQNLNAACSSSKSELTTTVPDDEAPLARASASAAFPSELKLNDSQRRVLAVRLEKLADELRQDVLDEGTARILSKRKTADPVRCEFDYIAKLASLALKGEFVLTDLGLRLRENRRQRAENERAVARSRALAEQRGLEVLKHTAGRQRKGDQSDSQ